MYKTDYGRNKSIYDEYLEGELSMEQIGKKYNISRQQISNIIMRYQSLGNKPGFKVLCELTNADTNLMNRLYAGLSKWFDDDNYSIYDIINIDIYEFFKQSSVGKSVADLLVEFQKELKNV